MKSFAVLSSALLIVCGACGSDSAPAPKIPENLLNCDITELGCQRGIFESVGEMLEQDATSMPPIRTISVARFEDETRSGISADDLAGDDPETRGLRLIGFIPDSGQSALETAIDLRLSSIAAYYSSRDRAITVIDRDYEDGSAQLILAHEFVHAFQDREFGIASVFSGADTTDRVMGARAVIEGDATYASFAWFYQQDGEDLLAIDWDAIYTDFQDGAKSDATDSTLPIDASASSFPYAYGMDLLGNATQMGGLAERATFFDAPPQSALDSMLGYDAFIERGFTAVDGPIDALAAPVDGSDLSVDDRSGAWYVYATLLRAGFEEADAWNGAIAWRGDRLGIFEDGAEVVAVWRIRLQDDPSFLINAIDQSPRDVTWSAQADGDEVYIIAAESDEALAVWEAQPLGVMAALVASVPDVRKGVLVRQPDGCSPPPIPAR